MGRRSQLKSKIIKKVWTNKRNYKYLDYDFKFSKKDCGMKDFKVSVYHFGTLILQLGVDEYTKTMYRKEEGLDFEVTYFNPQTDNDCFSINHILAVCSEDTLSRYKYQDRGNAEVMNNGYIFRKKENFYSFVKIWMRGKIGRDNYDRLLSYEFSTDEYINYIRSIFEIKRIQRRTIKKEFKSYLDKMLLLEKLNKK